MTEETERKAMAEIGKMDDVPPLHKQVAAMGVLMGANPDTIMGVLIDGISKRRGENLCDFEECPGRTARAKKRLIYHTKYLFVHNQCVSGAREAARRRGEMFGFRNGL